MPSTVRLTWQSSSGPGSKSARQSFQYEAFVPDPIANLDAPLPSSLIAEMSDVERLLRDLQVGSGFIGLEALSRQLLRAESVASSWIEGLKVSNRRLAQALYDPSVASATAREVIANIAAMEEAILLGDQADSITLEHIRAIHQRLLSATPLERYAGSFRTEQNWIGGHATSPLNAEFVPPPHDMVEGLMEDLCRFINRDDVAPIIQAAIAHSQFETIHPFVDGNGRVGRALIHVILRRRGLAPRFVPPVSIVLATNGGRYVKGLTSYRTGDLSDWCLLFIRTLRTATELSSKLATDVSVLQARWRATVETSTGRKLRSDAGALKIIHELPARIIVDRNIVREITGSSGEAARRAIEQLEDAGILSQVVLGKQRNRVWEAKELNQLLNEYEFELASPTRTEERPRSSPVPYRT